MEPYSYPLFDYIDPIYTPPTADADADADADTNTTTFTNQARAIMITVDIPSIDIDPNTSISISISPYKVNLKIIGYKKYIIYLCCAINPILSYYNICRPFDGCLSLIQLQVILQIDTRLFETVTDAGSKTWLLTQALSNNSNNSSVGDSNEEGDMSSDNPYKNEYGIEIDSRKSMNNSRSDDGNNRSNGMSADDSTPLPEDKFHIRLPSNVDQYTGVTIDDDRSDTTSSSNSKNKPKANNSSNKSVFNKPVVVNKPLHQDIEEQELPEDRFHQKDATSSYLINQRDQAKKDKWDKHEKLVDLFIYIILLLND